MQPEGDIGRINGQRLAGISGTVIVYIVKGNSVDIAGGERPSA